MDNIPESIRGASWRGREIHEPLPEPKFGVSADSAINYAFQQNAIPIVKELRFQNDDVARKDVVIRVFTEPAFAETAEIRIQAIEAQGDFRVSPLMAFCRR